MDCKILPVGYGNIVMANRVIGIVDHNSAPMRRIIHEAQDNGTCIDVTQGRRTRSVIIMDSGHIVLSSVEPETLGNRLDD